MASSKDSRVLGWNTVLTVFIMKLRAISTSLGERMAGSGSPASSPG